MKYKFKVGDYVKCICKDEENGIDYTRKAGVCVGDIIQIKYVEHSYHNYEDICFLKHGGVCLKLECFRLVKKDIEEYGISKWLNNLKGGVKCQTK